jgi:hypothetical protein
MQETVTYQGTGSKLWHNVCFQHPVPWCDTTGTLRVSKRSDGKELLSLLKLPLL